MTALRSRLSALVVLVAVIAAAVAFVLFSSQGSSDDVAEPAEPIELYDPTGLYDPVKAGVPMPEGFRQISFRDQIEPVYSAEFTSADKVDWPLDSLVIGVAGSATAKAYPVTHLNQREMVIDFLDGVPILVTWCPVCGSAMVHRRELDGSALILGNQGALFGNAMTWFDHETGSIWSQPLGEAIVGPRKGERIELLPSSLTTWEAWLAVHPDSQALDVHAWSTGFHLDQMAVVVDLGIDAASYEIRALREVGVVNDIVADLEIAVVIDPGDDQRWAVFSRRLDDSLVVELELTAQGLVDVATGTVFDPFLGNGQEGSLSDQSLDRLPAFTVFPDEFETFFPNGEIWPEVDPS